MKASGEQKSPYFLEWIKEKSTDFVYTQTERENEKGKEEILLPILVY